MVEREHSRPSLVRQCALLGLNRSSLYYRPTAMDQYDLEVMVLIDRQYSETPFYGSRRMTAWPRAQGQRVNRKRARRLMRLMGITAIYCPPNTSKPWRGHKVYPYLLRDVKVDRGNQVWGADITYIPNGAWLHVPGSHHGLVQPVCAGVEALEHHGQRFLR